LVAAVAVAQKQVATEQAAVVAADKVKHNKAATQLEELTEQQTLVVAVVVSMHTTIVAE
jgi:hypothetical protein